MTNPTPGAIRRTIETLPPNVRAEVRGLSRQISARRRELGRMRLGLRTCDVGLIASTMDRMHLADTDRREALAERAELLAPDFACEVCGGEATEEYFSAPDCNDTGVLVTVCSACIGGVS